jgi:hypothetical protein
LLIEMRFFREFGELLRKRNIVEERLGVSHQVGPRLWGISLHDCRQLGGGDGLTVDAGNDRLRGQLSPRSRQSEEYNNSECFH